MLSIFYLVASSRSARDASASRLGRAFALLGRHSLEVFTAGTLIDLFGKLAFDALGDGWPMQVTVNVVGIGVLFALASTLERRKRAARTRLAAA